MLALGKKVDYALISLAYMAERSCRFISAREIAELNDLPLPALMQILKDLHVRGVLQSTRGVKGGYQIGINIETLSLYELSEILDSAEGGAEDVGVALHGAPLHAIREKLAEFVRGVRVLELISPGKGIDVPLQSLRIVDRPMRAVEPVSV